MSLLTTLVEMFLLPWSKMNERWASSANPLADWTAESFKFLNYCIVMVFRVSVLGMNYNPWLTFQLKSDGLMITSLYGLVNSTA